MDSSQQLDPNDNGLHDGVEADTIAVPLLSAFRCAKDEPHSSVAKKSRNRLASLDVFRGLTIAVMILVDDVGGLWPNLNHSPWDGVTLADFVMPFFLFIVGISVVLSLKNAVNRLDTIKKLILRTFKLLFLGLFVQGGYFHGVNYLEYGVDIRHIRIMGVLQRISIAYFVVSISEVATKDCFTHRDIQNLEPSSLKLLKMYHYHWSTIFAISFVYVCLLYGLKVPDWDFRLHMSADIMKVSCNVRGDLSPACNAVGFIDRTILGINHLYQHPVYTRSKECSTLSPDYGPLPVNAPSWCLAPFDPEGLLSSLMAVASCFIGAHYAHVLVHFKSHKQRLFKWIINACCLCGLGLLFAWLGLPLNKPLYTVSYMFITAGAAGIVFSITYILVDVWEYRKPFILLQWMGMNALLIFVLAACGIFPSFFQGFYWTSPQNNMVSFVEIRIFQKIVQSKRWSKMAYVLFEILFWCLIAGVLKWKGIFWKL